MTLWTEAWGLYEWASPGLGVVGPIVTLWAEHHWKIVSRVKMGSARLFNLSGRVRCFFLYRQRVPFDDLKKAIRSNFRETRNFEVEVDTPSRLLFVTDIFSVNVFPAEDGGVAVEVKETACGMRDMREQILALIRPLTKMAEGDEPPLGPLQRAELHITPPVRWPEVSTRPPRGYALNSYAVTMRHEKTGSELVITLEGIALQYGSGTLVESALGTVL